MGKVIDLKRNVLYIMSGLPGSGKSRFLEQVPTFMVVSTDSIRIAISDTKKALDSELNIYDSLSQESNVQVFNILRTLVDEKCRLGLTTFVDATNLSDTDRAEFVRIAEKYNMESEILIMDTPIKNSIRLNKQRGKRVEDYVFAKLEDKLEIESRFNYRLIKNNYTINFYSNEIKDLNLDIVGDIHGLKKDFEALLISMGYEINGYNVSHKDNRKLLFLGDFIDRGEDSIEILYFIMNLVQKQGHYAVLGNHEQKFLLNYLDLQNKKELLGGLAGKITLIDFLKEPIAKQNSILKFLKSTPFYYVYGNSICTHGNIISSDLDRLTRQDCYYGFTRNHYEPIDTDLLYQQGFDKGINKYSLIRGHIPFTSTSDLKNVLVLDRQQAFEGELVAARYENFSFKETFTQKCDFNFDKYIEHNNLLKFETVIKEKLAKKYPSPDNTMYMYKYVKSVFYDALWSKNDLLLKSRGIVLDIAGNILQHPFDKIFNYGEKYKGLKTGYDIDDNEVVIAVEKYNGFLGNIGFNPITKQLLITTTGSFDSQFVDYIKDFITKEVNSKLFKFFNKNHVTLSFEVIHPKDPHIIQYDPKDMGLVLIGARNLNFEDTSFAEEEVDSIGEELGFKRPNWFRIRFGELKKLVNRSELEGYIVRKDSFKQEPLLKFKTPYYLITKLIGRMTDLKIRIMYKNPEYFKKDLDEEFFELVDMIVSTISEEDFVSKTEEQKISLIRDMIQTLRA